MKTRTQTRATLNTTRPKPKSFRAVARIGVPPPRSGPPPPTNFVGRRRRIVMPAEIIVLDDDSEDGSPELLKVIKTEMPESSEGHPGDMAVDVGK